MVLWGTLINALLIVIGTLIGRALRNIPDRMKETVMYVIGLVVVVLGLQMGFESQNFVIVIISLVLGTVIGEWARLEDKLNAFGQGAAQEDIILPFEAGLDDIPALDLSLEQARAVQQGRVLTGIAMKDGLHWARGVDLCPIALGENIDGTLKTVRGFNLMP